MGEEYVRFALENPAHYRLMYASNPGGAAGLPPVLLVKPVRTVYEPLNRRIEGGLLIRR